jgi:hypothetical protein
MARPADENITKFEVDDFPSIYKKEDKHAIDYYERTTKKNRQDLQKHLATVVSKETNKPLYSTPKHAQRGLKQAFETGYIKDNVYLAICNWLGSRLEYYHYRSKTVKHKPPISSGVLLRGFCEEHGGSTPSEKDIRDFDHIIVSFCKERKLIPQDCKSAKEEWHNFFEIK